MSDKKILVVGDVMLDIYHLGKVDRISPEAPVPVFLETGQEKYVPGGAANVAVNIAAIGVDVELCAVVGRDEAAEKLKALLKEQNVGIHMLCENQERRTTKKLRYIGPNHQQILRADTEDVSEIPYEAVADKLREASDHIDQYGLFLLSDYRKGLLTEEITQAFIRLANDNEIPVFVDVKDKNFQKYRNAALLKPNRKELAELTAMPADTREEVIKAAGFLCKKASCRYVLTTLGAEGMLLVEQDYVSKEVNEEKSAVREEKEANESESVAREEKKANESKSAARKVKEVKSAAKDVYDVTGAGDTSIAYLAAEVVLGKEITEAMEIANYAAGIQVSKVGTSIVYPEEVAAAMRQSDQAGEEGSSLNGRSRKENVETGQPDQVEKKEEEKWLDFYAPGGLDRLKEKQQKGCKIVFTNGCFDILHAGHIAYLKEAKKLGDILVVGVNTDESVKRLKGDSRPINTLEDRLLLLSALEIVDYVVPFGEDTPLELIKKTGPDVLVKGGDYRIDTIVGAEEVLERGGEVQSLPFIAGKSTTGILEKL